ncbi:hypothetical protein PG989_010632 [Apiospora arundinis]|uniref:DUF7708 domain-containing protein n=1 Tax=Apiospora arundinis TaxID=335852 RepID=A0ABR2HPP0_9PEZI
MSVNTAKPALGIVRRYTEESMRENEQSTLKHALATKVSRDIQNERQGKQLFGQTALEALDKYENRANHGETDAFLKIAELDEVCDSLQPDWDKVTNLIPKEERQDIPSKPNIRFLLGMFEKSRQRLEARQQSKSGKVRGWFRGVAQTMNRHKYLLQLLPDGDKYTSVLVGAFTTLIQVSVTYEETAEQISDCLEQISDQVYHLQHALQADPDQLYLKQQIANFYCHMFRFLVYILTEWLSGSAKRLSSSLGNSILGVCQGTISKMERCRKNVMDYLVTNQHIKLAKLGALVEAGFVGRIVDQEKSHEFVQSNYQAIQLNASPPMLQDAAPHSSPPRTLPDAHENPSTPVEANRDDAELHIFWDKPKIRDGIENLRNSVRDEEMAALVHHAQDVSVPNAVRFELLRIITSTESAGIWLEDRPHRDEPSPGTLTCAYMLGALRQLQIPAVAHFIGYPHRDNYHPLDREQELLELVCSLVYQLAEVMPDKAYVTKDLGSQVKAMQNSSERDAIAVIGAAIEMMEDLIAAGPPLLFCLVDGLQLLERDANSTHMRDALRRFMAALCRPLQRGRPTAVEGGGGGEARIFKVLVSTNGHCALVQLGVKAGALEHEEFNDKDIMDEPLDIRGRDFAF